MAYVTEDFQQHKINMFFYDSILPTCDITIPMPILPIMNLYWIMMPFIFSKQDELYLFADLIVQEPSS